MEDKSFDELIEKLRSISANKKQINILCNEFNITPKELTLSLFDKCLKGLCDIREKINKDCDLENEDWLEVAVPFDSIVNILMNKWYKDEQI